MQWSVAVCVLCVQGQQERALVFVTHLVLQSLHATESVQQYSSSVRCTPLLADSRLIDEVKSFL